VCLVSRSVVDVVFVEAAPGIVGKHIVSMVRTKTGKGASTHAGEASAAKIISRGKAAEEHVSM
jgi:hypothetical protein